MRIAMASDHGGFALKQAVAAYLREQGHQVEDFGCHSTESCDYPDFAGAAAKAVASGACERGIVVCSTGIGISIAANKVSGIRCALCGDLFSVEMTRRHNNANMLALGAFLTPPPLGYLAERIVDVFLNTEFEGGRHQRRVDKISALEEQSQS